MDIPSHPSTHYRSDKASADPNKVSSAGADLPVSAGASLDELRGEWRRLYRGEPPRISRDLLLRGIGVVTLSQTERNLPTTANVDARDFSDLACWLIVQIGPISLNVTTPFLQ